MHVFLYCHEYYYRFTIRIQNINHCPIAVEVDRLELGMLPRGIRFGWSWSCVMRFVFLHLLHSVTVMYPLRPHSGHAQKSFLSSETCPLFY